MTVMIYDPSPAEVADDLRDKIEAVGETLLRMGAAGFNWYVHDDAQGVELLVTKHGAHSVTQVSWPRSHVGLLDPGYLAASAAEEAGL